MASSFLFHGPSAKAAACDEAIRIGRLLVPPIGDDAKGLAVDQVREAVNLINSVPLGDGRSAVVLGPLDGTASSKSSDALLKTIEDGGSGFVIPVLWALDLGGVPRTIRSRCLERWAPGRDVVSLDDADELVFAAAWSATEAALKRDYAAIISAIQILRKKDAKGLEFLRLVAESLATRLDDLDACRLWDQVREALQSKQPTTLEVVASLLLDT